VCDDTSACDDTAICSDPKHLTAVFGRRFTEYEWIDVDAEKSKQTSFKSYCMTEDV